MKNKRLVELLVLPAAASAAHAATHRAPVQITQPAPFLTLEATAEAWQHGAGADLRDWQLLDARRRGVPFALMPEASRDTDDREIKLFALPPAPAASSASAPRSTTPAGWVLDLGEPGSWPAAPKQVQLRWPPESPAFQAGYRLDTSADLQAWQSLGTGQLLGLHTADGFSLSQPQITLPARPQRYLRLVWDDAQRAALPNGAWLAFQAVGDTPMPLRRTTPVPALDADGGWVVSLGGLQPVTALALSGDHGTWVLPVQVQTRPTPQSAWRTVARPVFYRVDRGTAPADAAPPLQRDLGVGELRLLPPRGAALPPPGSLRLDWTVRSTRIVWAAQGEPPFSLQVGSTTPETGPRPLSDVVPDWNREQSRLGKSELGAFTAQPDAPTTEPALPPRRLLLWGVLGLGVLLLAGATWRLWRQGPTSTST